MIVGKLKIRDCHPS